MKQQKQHKPKKNEFNRRDFLRGSSAATFMTLLGGVELTMDRLPARAADAEKLHGPAVKSAVIGLGGQGRKRVCTTACIPQSQVVAVRGAPPPLQIARKNSTGVCKENRRLG